MTKEEWNDIPGYEGTYKISSFGQVMACAKSWQSGRWLTRHHPDKIMVQAVDRKGYCKVGLRKNGSLKNYAVHRLVAISFIPNPENKPDVNHKDTNKRNNHKANLEWATRSENMQHAHDNGLMNLRIGAKHPRAKLKADDVLAIRSSNLSDYALAKQYGMSRSALREARIGKTWPNINSQFIEQQTENK
jgi:hypothetical protein